MDLNEQSKIEEIKAKRAKKLALIAKKLEHDPFSYYFGVKNRQLRSISEEDPRI